MSTEQKYMYIDSQWLQMGYDHDEANGPHFKDFPLFETKHT